MAIELPVIITGTWQGQTRPGGEFESEEMDSATGELIKKTVPYGPTWAVTYFDAEQNFKLLELKSSALDGVADEDVAAIEVGTQVAIRGQAYFFESKKVRGQGFFKFEVQDISRVK